MSDGTDGIVLACCGLVCSDCGAFKKNKCGGCHCDKPMNLGCKVKPCVMDRGCGSCAGCADFENLKDCGKLNNFVSKIFGFVFRSDRIDNLNRIREVGVDEFKEER